MPAVGRQRAGAGESTSAQELTDIGPASHGRWRELTHLWRPLMLPCPTTHVVSHEARPLPEPLVPGVGRLSPLRREGALPSAAAVAPRSPGAGGQQAHGLAFWRRVTNRRAGDR